MRRVIALELVGLKKLACDLYDENGNVVYKKETEFTPEIFMMLSQTKIFKRDEENITDKEPESTDKKKKYFTESGNSNSQDSQNKTNSVENEKTKLTPPSLRKDFNNISKAPASLGKPTSKIQEELKKARAHKVKISEPLNKPEIAEFKSVVAESSKNNLLNNVKEVLHSALNETPLSLDPCLMATDTILNEVYTKLRSVDRVDELRIHDYYTFTHSLNVAIISAVIGRELGFNENKVKDLTFSAFLHDVGKMKIPKEIIYKPGKLTPEEMQLVRRHSELGYKFIKTHLGLPEKLARPALEHHERWEGQGYPQGLKGKQIAEFSQIIAIADVYDALVSEKIYKGSIKAVDAMKVMLTEESRSFNPEFLNKFIYMSALNKNYIN